MKRCLWTLAAIPALFAVAAQAAAPSPRPARNRSGGSSRHIALVAQHRAGPAGYNRWREHAEHQIPLPYTPPDQIDGALQDYRGPSGLFAPTFLERRRWRRQRFQRTRRHVHRELRAARHGRRRRRDAVRASRQRRFRRLQQGDQARRSTDPCRPTRSWSGFGGACQTNNDGDPVVVYDKARQPLDHLAVLGRARRRTCSASPSRRPPTRPARYYRYSFSYGSVFPDYPKMGVWPDAYYETFNMFNAAALVRGLEALRLRPRADAGRRGRDAAVLPARAPSFGGVLPADLDGSTPAARRLAELHGRPWRHRTRSTSGNSTSTGAHPANTTLHRPDARSRSRRSRQACGGGTCIPQSGTQQKLDSLADRLMFRLAYRNFGRPRVAGREPFGAVGPRGSIVPACAGTSCAIASGNADRLPAVRPTRRTRATAGWAAIAMDQAGQHGARLQRLEQLDAAPGDPLHRPPRHRSAQHDAGRSARIIDRRRLADRPALDRWGDYSAMTVDPVDDCTFWYTTEYLKANGAFNWSTRIGSFKFPGCQ